MATRITIDPMTRVEGHFRVQVTVDAVAGVQQVVDAQTSSTLFRGLERILVGRLPREAQHITQRVCGLCPTSHGIASVTAIEKVAGVVPPPNARLLRALLLGADFIQSHLTHFYHLALLDYVDGPGSPPWQPSWRVDRRLGATAAGALIQHHMSAIVMRREAHEMAALIGGRMPHPPALVPGGITAEPTATLLRSFAAHLDKLISFIEGAYVPDVEVLGAAYPDYYALGRGPANMLAFGGFGRADTGTGPLFRRGRAMPGANETLPLDVGAITEDVSHAWYRPDEGDGHPARAQAPTTDAVKPDAYSWSKAPRYSGEPYETGPLARMWISGGYRHGISAMDRHRARSLETLTVARAMHAWLERVRPGAPVLRAVTPELHSGSAYSLIEAPRGALGHWISVEGGRIERYQLVTPTCWNVSPCDAVGRRGPLEDALVGTPVRDIEQPVEVLRVVHSMDPCLACAVHAIRA